MFTVIWFGVIIVIVASVAYLAGMKSRKQHGAALPITDDTNILKLRALSPQMQQKIKYEYNKCLKLDDKNDLKFRNVKCD